MLRNILSSLNQIPFYHSHPPNICSCLVPGIHRVNLSGIHITWLFDRVSSKCLEIAFPASLPNWSQKRYFWPLLVFFFSLSFLATHMSFISRGKKSLPFLLCRENLLYPPLDCVFARLISTTKMAVFGTQACVRTPAWLLLLKVQVLRSWFFFFSFSWNQLGVPYASVRRWQWQSKLVNIFLPAAKALCLRCHFKFQATVRAPLSGGWLEGERSTTVIPFAFIEGKGLPFAGKDSSTGGPVKNGDLFPPAWQISHR